MVQTNFLGGGLSNHINCHSHYGVIAGGHSNCIGLTGGTPAGAFHNFIGGGCNNQICDNNSFGAILGGCNNLVQHNFAGVFGCNVTTAGNCLFHINNLNLNAIPGILPGSAVPSLPGGSLYFICYVGLCCPIFVV